MSFKKNKWVTIIMLSLVGSSSGGAYASIQDISSSVVSATPTISVGKVELNPTKINSVGAKNRFRFQHVQKERLLSQVPDPDLSEISPDLGGYEYEECDPDSFLYSESLCSELSPSIEDPLDETEVVGYVYEECDPDSFLYSESICSELSSPIEDPLVEPEQDAGLGLDPSGEYHICYDEGTLDYNTISCEAKRYYDEVDSDPTRITEVNFIVSALGVNDISGFINENVTWEDHGRAYDGDIYTATEAFGYRGDGSGYSGPYDSTYSTTNPRETFILYTADGRMSPGSLSITFQVNAGLPPSVTPSGGRTIEVDVMIFGQNQNNQKITTFNHPLGTDVYTMNFNTFGGEEKIGLRFRPIEPETQLEYKFYVSEVTFRDGDLP